MQGLSVARNEAYTHGSHRRDNTVRRRCGMFLFHFCLPKDTKRKRSSWTPATAGTDQVMKGSSVNSKKETETAKCTTTVLVRRAPTLAQNRLRSEYDGHQQQCHMSVELLSTLFHFAFRPVDHVRGFTRETLVPIFANIESQEMCRDRAEEIGPEHPRASSTNQSECFISCVRDRLGAASQETDLKAFLASYLHQTPKRIDDSLNFLF